MILIFIQLLITSIIGFIKVVVLGVVFAKALHYFVLVFTTQKLALAAYDYVFFIALVIVVALFIREMKLNTKQKPKLIDINTLFDGRIREFIEKDVLENKILIPYFIINKINCDLKSKDHQKFNQAKYARDILDYLQKRNRLKIVFKNYKKENDLNKKIISIAKYYRASILTTDFIVQAMACKAQVDSVNMLELLNCLETRAVPGNNIIVYLLRSGKKKEDAVGYLNDGTLVIVEKAKSFIGRKVLVNVLRVVEDINNRKVFGSMVEVFGDKT